MDALHRLQLWYGSHCDGTWEHRKGIEIISCDNPGWWVKIDLKDTSLEKAVFREIAVNVDEKYFPIDKDWLVCRVDSNRIFNGAGDVGKLSKILDVFLDWADSHSDINTPRADD